MCNYPKCNKPFRVFEPAHDKTDNKTFVTNKDSDQHIHPQKGFCFILDQKWNDFVSYLWINVANINSEIW